MSKAIIPDQFLTLAAHPALRPFGSMEDQFRMLEQKVEGIAVELIACETFMKEHHTAVQALQVFVHRELKEHGIAQANIVNGLAFLTQRLVNVEQAVQGLVNNQYQMTRRMAELQSLLLRKSRSHKKNPTPVGEQFFKNDPPQLQAVDNKIPVTATAEPIGHASPVDVMSMVEAKTTVAQIEALHDLRTEADAAFHAFTFPQQAAV